MSLLVRTTLAMVVVPLSVMIFFYFVLLDHLSFVSAADKMLWAGVAALCSVQLVVFCFLFVAFRESDDDVEDVSAAGAAADASAPPQKKVQ